MSFVRGRVYEADIEGVGPKFYLVVSNNVRNRNLGSALVVRLTTTSKHPRPSIVDLPDGEAFNGRVLCDNVTTLYDDDNARDAGALSARTMTAVGDGLKAAFDLD